MLIVLYQYHIHGLMSDSENQTFYECLDLRTLSSADCRTRKLGSLNEKNLRKEALAQY